MAGITLREEALDQLRRLIVSGDWSHEAPKRSERELADTLGMSRTPVREALAILVQHGLVNNYPQVGVEVRVPTLYEANQVLLLRRGIESIVVADLSVRAEGEPAVVRAVEDLAQQLRTELLTGDVRLPEVRLAFREADTAFHSGMAELAGFTASVPLIRSLRDRIHLYRLVHSPPDLGEEWNATEKLTNELMNTVEEHKEIVGGIASGKRRLAVRALVKHLNSTRKRLIADSRQNQDASEANDTVLLAG